ncbi:MAG: hypothetical protein H6622_07555 [Halobacteriovoraceae bacterium]|nr:hypothetical protein [Halobacteriovoraceae bacterium]
MLLKFNILIYFLIFSLKSLAFGPGNKKIVTDIISFDTKYGKTEIHLNLRESEKIYRNKIKRIIQEKYPLLINYFKHAPNSPVNLFYTDESNSANGFATPFPGNIVGMNEFPPYGNSSLMSMSDWLESLIVHELTHILHLDQTRGYTKVLTFLLGSAGKAPSGIVPRWFTEGIAVWAETHFSPGGRAKSQWLTTQIKEKIQRGGFCETIDCIADPGKHPHGSNAYWTGGIFLSSLEKKWPGFISCVTNQAVGRFPGFLNGAFETCNPKGMNATHLFEQFIMGIKAQGKLEEKEIKKNEVYFQDFINLDWEKGLSLKGNHIFYAKDTELADELWMLNLKDGTQTQIDIDRSLQYLPPASSIFESHAIALGEEREDQTVLIWRLINSAGNISTLDLEEQKGHLYFMQTPSKEIISLDLSDNNWVVYKNGKEYSAFSKLFSVNSPIGFTYKGEEGFVFKTYENEKHIIMFFGLKSKKLKSIFKYEDELSISGLCSDTLVVFSKNNMIGIDQSGGKTSKSLEREILWAGVDKNLISIIYTDHPSFVEVNNAKCHNYLGTTALKIGPLENKHSKTSKIKTESVSYPRFSQFLPKYWIPSITYLYDEIILSALTSINDPMNYFSMNFQVDHLSDQSETGGLVNLSYRIKNDWFFSLETHKGFSYDDLLGKFRENRLNTAQILYKTEHDRFVANYILSYNNQKSSDAFDNFQNDYFDAIFSYHIDGHRRDNFWMFSNITFYNSYTKSDSTDNFYTFRARNENRFNLFRDLSLNVELAYSRMNKKTTAGGLVYGGITSYGTETFHNFVGVPYLGLLGNELSTGDLKFRYDFLDIYHSSGFVPFFFKDVAILAGSSAAHTDYLITNSVFKKNTSVYSYYVGFQLRVTMFYNIDMIIESYSTKLLDENFEKIPNAEQLFLIKLGSSRF